MIAILGGNAFGITRGVAATGTPPTSDFSADVTSGVNPLTVHFSDDSTGSPTSWVWNFGDGTTSTAQNPTKTFTTIGSFNVSLTATNAAGAGTTMTKTGFITVNSAPTSTAKPRTAIVAYKLVRPNATTAPGATLGALHAKSNIVVTHLYIRYNVAQREAYMNAIRAANPACKVYNYVVPGECSPTSAQTEFIAHLNLNRSDGKDGWMRNAAGSRGYEFAVQYETNCYTNATVGGKTVWQWHAEYVTATHFSGSGYTGARIYDGIFVDNIFEFARAWGGVETGTVTSTYDYDRDGTNDAIDSAMHLARRTWNKNYYEYLRTLNPGYEIIGNTSGTNHNAAPYVANDVTLGYIEGTSGFATVNDFFSRYTGMKANTGGKIIVETAGDSTAMTSATQCQKMRYWLALTHMKNGGYQHFRSNPSTQWYYYVEYAQTIGEPVATEQTAARSNSMWFREYDFGLFIANPSGATQTVLKSFLDTLGNWKFINGAGGQSPASYYTGANVTANFTLPSLDGILLLRQ